MPHVLLVHWKPADAEIRAAALRRAGHVVEVLRPEGAKGLRLLLRDYTPEAIVIDLTRLPSHGRAVAVALRQQKATRYVPLVFAGGAPEKVAAIQELLPDASFTEWSHIEPCLRVALANPPRNPIVPGTMDSYSSTPLPAKLRIKRGSAIALLNAPEDFIAKLQPLPDDAAIVSGRASANLVRAQRLARLSSQDLRRECGSGFRPPGTASKRAKRAFAPPWARPTTGSC